MDRKRITLSMKTEVPNVRSESRSKSKANPNFQPKPKPVQRKKVPSPDGDLQAKLAMLKGKFGS